MKRSFPQFYDHYVSVCQRLVPTLQGAPMRDPFGERRGRFEPNQLLQRLEALKKKLNAEGYGTEESIACAEESQPEDDSKMDTS